MARCTVRLVTINYRIPDCLSTRNNYFKIVFNIFINTRGKSPITDPPPNTDPSRISVTIRDIKKLYRHALLAI